MSMHLSRAPHPHTAGHSRLRLLCGYENGSVTMREYTGGPGATSIEGPIGTAASIHFACSEPGINYGTELFGPQLFAVELLKKPLEYSDGQVHLPEGPGLGVELDMDVVKKYARD